MTTETTSPGTEAEPLTLRERVRDDAEQPRAGELVSVVRRAVDRGLAGLQDMEGWALALCDAVDALRIGRDDAEAHVERLTEECKKERERADLLERSAAVTMCERDALQKLADGWKAAALNRLGKCVACDGAGVMELDGEEGSQPTAEPCGKCGGTGRGDVAHAFAHLVERAQAEELMAEKSGGLLSDVCDAAFDDEERAATHGYAGVVGQVLALRLAAAQRDAALRRVEQAEIDRGLALGALTDAVGATSDKTEIGQRLRRALALCR